MKLFLPNPINRPLSPIALGNDIKSSNNHPPVKNETLLTLKTNSIYRLTYIFFNPSIKMNRQGLTGLALLCCSGPLQTWLLLIRCINCILMVWRNYNNNNFGETFTRNIIMGRIWKLSQESPKMAAFMDQTHRPKKLFPKTENNF